ADTALRTADSGYLTRRLVDVSQDVIIRTADAESNKGITLPVAERDHEGKLVPHEYAETSLYGRLTVNDVTDAEGNVVVPAKSDVSAATVDALVAAGVEEIKVHSVLTADSDTQTSAMHWRRSMDTGKHVCIGVAIGTVAAQSIGVPGTQRTTRPFHTGGAAASSGDITQGLPRVTERFEARTPKGFATIAEATGRAKIDDRRKTRFVIITPDDGSDQTEEALSTRRRHPRQDGQQRQTHAAITCVA